MQQPARKSKRPRGRPPLPKGEGKRSVIALRATAKLRHLLEANAAGTGRSLSQEAEHLLERALRDEAILGGRELAGLFQMMAGAAAMIEERRGGKKWSEDYDTFMAIRAAWQTLIRQASPEMPGDVKKEFETFEVDDPMSGPPSPPQRPAPKGSTGLLFGGSRTPEQQAEIEAARKEYERKLAVWDAAATEWLKRAEVRVRNLEAIGEKYAGLAQLGIDAAAQMLPPRGSKAAKT